MRLELWESIEVNQFLKRIKSRVYSLCIYLKYGWFSNGCDSYYIIALIVDSNWTSAHPYYKQNTLSPFRLENIHIYSKSV